MIQSALLNPLIDALRAHYGHARFVERAKDGFQDSGRWAYVRADELEDYEITFDEDWMLGEYVVVAEDTFDCNIAADLYELVETAGGEVTGISTRADSIYRAETEDDRRREMNVAKLAFTLRTPKLNCLC